jgi:TRAP-type mannitol/chloroaromatic compound transport system substrate-binding protein
MAKYDVGNAAALRRLVAAGTELRPFSEGVLDACFKAANETYAEISAKNEGFKKVYEAMRAQRADNYLWFQLSENTYDTYMMIQQRKKTL